MYLDIADSRVEGCCSLNTIFAFPSDEHIHDEIEESRLEAKENKLSFNAKEAREDILNDIRIEIAGRIDIPANIVAILTKEQSIVLSICKKLGFIEMATYQGNEGHVTILMSGVTKVRSRSHKKAVGAKTKRRKAA